MRHWVEPPSQKTPLPRNGHIPQGKAFFWRSIEKKQKKLKAAISSPEDPDF